MFSIGTAYCSECSVVEIDDHAATEKIKNPLIADSVLAVIFSIIAILGLTGVLPLAVGITFCVLAVLQIALSSAIAAFDPI